MNTNIKKVYSILKKEENQHSLNFLIRIHFSHPIFEGHFPKKPILPGVIMCTIIKNLISDTLGIEIQLKKAKNIKFLKMITPDKSNLFNVNLLIRKEGDYNIKAIITKNKEIYFKLNAEYKKK